MSNVIVRSVTLGLDEPDTNQLPTYAGVGHSTTHGIAAQIAQLARHVQFALTVEWDIHRSPFTRIRHLFLTSPLPSCGMRVQ